MNKIENELTLWRGQIAIPIPYQKDRHTHTRPLIFGHGDDVVMIPRRPFHFVVQFLRRLQRLGRVQAEYEGESVGILDLVPQHGLVRQGPKLQQLDCGLRPRDVHELSTATIVIQRGAGIIVGHELGS